MKQKITYCGVNAHFQNGRAEKRIRDLQDMARTQLIHAQEIWPGVVSNNLWPYAIRYSNLVKNATTDTRVMESPIEMFSQTPVWPKIKHFHPFGCPVYVLDGLLQSNKSIPKWNHRSRLALNLGPSPRHARSVALVLNLHTGMASPQYHVRYDHIFKTVKEGKKGYVNLNIHMRIP